MNGDPTMWAHAGTIFTIAGFILTSIVTLVTVTRSLSNTEIALRQAITQSKDEVEEQIARSRADIEAKQERMSREFGETVKALKEKVHEIETWARDEFVRKGSFEHSIGRFERTVSDQFTKIDQRLERMEAKIDSKT